MKTCNECGQSKPDSEYFSAPSYQCKPCKRELDRARYAPIKAAVKAKRLESYRDGKKRCTVCKRFKSTDQYHPHPTHWDRLAHECKSCKSKQAKTYYHANREKMSAKGKRDYKLHREERLAKGKEWRKNNLDKSHQLWHRYNGHKKRAEGSFTKDQWLALVAHYAPDSVCLSCNRKRKLNKEHVVPLSKGGSNYITNIQPLCASCNSEKHQHSTDYRPDAGEFAKSLL